MSKDQLKLANLTKADIEAYLALHEERLSLQRQARDKEREAEELEQKIWAWVDAKGGDARSCERSGFVLAIKTRAGSVQWKTEFIRVAGAEEAEKLTSAAPPREFLSIEAKG
jgi:hypothetical protein